MKSTDLTQLNQDTRDSIRGKNNYNPHVGHGRESHHPPQRANDLANDHSWQDDVMEIE